MLKAGLKLFYDRGRKDIIITCKDFNIASKKVIEKNGGIFLNYTINPQEKYRYLRYKINI